MKLGKLLKLGSQIYLWRLFNWRCILLLGLHICGALLISLIVLLLRHSILLCIFLLLVVAYCTGSAHNYRRAYGSGPNTRDWSSYHCSSA
ncbi:MAG: hypothetical protein MUC85_11850 [Anaerolineales bacterium]|nr:hypothetical protein [Anaerolineales bacterium]